MFLALLTNINVDFLKQFPNTTSLYKAGIIYRQEGLGLESWKSVPIVLEDGFGDCEDLACWLAAEYRVKGINARPVWTKRQLGRLTMYHIQTQLPDGTTEDPSIKLGMKGSG